VPIVIDNVEKMSAPEIPITAVKSAYSIKSCPLSSVVNFAAIAVAN
jgi:hypothetical protein